jgi:hypothetical protein
MINLLNQDERSRLIANIDSENNKARKQVSLKSSEVAGGRLEQYVKDKLRGELAEESVKEMPLVSSINIQKAITDKKATIYKRKPTRRFTETSDDQKDTLDRIYKDMKLDMNLNKANKNYIYQEQTIGMIVPQNGKLITRIMKMHQIDVVPSATDPEQADAYILSAFDRTLYIQHDTDKKDYATATGVHGRANRSTASEDTKVEVAEKYQFQKYVEKYIVWTKDLHFMMNGLGEVINPDTGEADSEIDISNPIGMMPFFEVAKDKDFEYFVRSSNALTDFTIQFNTQLSDLSNNIKMNGYAIGVLKSPSDMMPTNVTIGASMLLKLPTDNPDAEVDFEFTNPSSNIAEISEAIDKFLNYFVTSEGLGGSVVNSRGDSEKASSGIDRYLMMLSKIESHVDDYEAFNCAEHEIFKIIKKWLSVLDSSQLDQKYQTTLPENSELEIDYYKPEMIETETEKLTNIEKKLDMELMSKKQAVMALHGIEDEGKAQDLLDDIRKDNELSPPMVIEPTNFMEDDAKEES